MIAQKMNLGIATEAYRVRWKRLIQDNRADIWTSADDEELLKAVDEVHKSGFVDKESKDFWRAVALKLRHIPRYNEYLYVRWKALRHKKREKHKVWLQEEKDRLNDALEMVVCVSDPPARVEQARRNEPWLALSIDLPNNLVNGFWKEIARRVGTRSPHQCLVCYWALKEKNLRKNMTIDEVKQLAMLVEKHGTCWAYIKRHFFPQFGSSWLMYSYKKWREVSNKYHVNLHSIDPLAMLPGYTGGTKALRPTGIDGKYDPHGALAEVYIRGQCDTMMPFRLALCTVGDMAKRRIEGSRTTFITKNTDQRALLQRSSSYTLDKVVAAIGKHGTDDMEVVAREVGLPLEQCNLIAKNIAHILPSVAQSASLKEKV
ncbi:hypothetical protein LPJ64_002571 [Coemansia asiatica]|uniref:Myb-like domain-containing protein n=1 Tax=Coemansia asiatica TaxID=1052880 RepID=A0A9W7XLF1_9FUNG|nr:hypothetical protein LPJ64_002571 [Coemansia asiatica]